MRYILVIVLLLLIGFGMQWYRCRPVMVLVDGRRYIGYNIPHWCNGAPMWVYPDSSIVDYTSY